MSCDSHRVILTFIASIVVVLVQGLLASLLVVTEGLQSQDSSIIVRLWIGVHPPSIVFIMCIIHEFKHFVYD